MGGYSSDDGDDDDNRKSKKTSRRRSRSPSSESRSSRVSKHKKHRRSRKRSRSRSSKKRSRSSRHQRSRSYSSGRYRSQSRDRYRSRASSRDRRRSSSRSRSRSKSYERKRRSFTRSLSKESSSQKSSSNNEIKSMADMSESERSQALMQLAIDRAKAADEAIRLRHGVESETPADTKKRLDAIAQIEADGFSQQSFSSKQITTIKQENKENEFSFGTSLDFLKISKEIGNYSEETIFHARFFEDLDKRKARWLERLKTLQEKYMK